MTPGERRPAPLLVLAIGNPSRGDDALGPLFAERIAAALAAEVARGELEVLGDFQLQIEHALDLAGRARVVFVDASVSAAPPFELARVEARSTLQVSTHALCPEDVLETHRRVVGGQAPEAWVLAIRGEQFELGEALSEAARGHLDAAVESFLASQATPAGGRRIEVEGIVQGVGFRPWVHRTARSLGLMGVVKNTRRGVTIEAFGSGPSLDALVRALQERPPGAARVRAVRVTPLGAPPADLDGFVIVPSDASPQGRGALMLPPDLATCEACLRDVDDPRSRYHGYPFISCTDCGPRLGVATSLPYDRESTTMAAFPPCEACLREYHDPSDRRFHAQTIACPACGPRLWLASPSGTPLGVSDAIGAAAALLREGKVVAVQGLGAFHLVCDATSASAVAELRRRKRRDEQPLAVMVRDMAAALELVELCDELRAALVSPARPIVLAPSRALSAITPAVNGPSERTGVMLPYTALHHLLIAKVERPLVVTSGNPSGGPAVIDHAEALCILGPLVDAFLLHDRVIPRRVEDSVVAQAPEAGAGARVLRRSRGLSPSPLRLPLRAKEPVLAAGGHMKSTACLVVDDLAYLTPHLGDLGLVEGEAAWRRDVEGYEALLGVRAEVVAHDLHPEYTSTRYALERPARLRVGVQHHVAHVLAAVAELQLDEPVIGVVFDGTGFGTDGTAWGAEILLVEGARWTRPATFRALPLPGGERAIREVWRVALGALVEAFGEGEALALSARLGVFAGVTEAARATTLRMIASGTSTPRARGMGRWFDAVGALSLGLSRASFDGHVAIALEQAAGPASACAPRSVRAYAVAVPDAGRGPGPVEIDLRPTVRALVSDLLDGVGPAEVSARFHATLIDATAKVVAGIVADTGLRSVVLSGGSMQNRILERGLRERLAGRVNVAREVPVNDGGLALGQAWAAVLALAGETA